MATHETRRHEGEKTGAPPSDERAADALLALLDEELELGERAIKVTYDDGSFRLEGEVQDRETRRRAEEIARGHAKAQRVDNRLRVETSEPRDVQPDPDERR